MKWLKSLAPLLCLLCVWTIASADHSTLRSDTQSTLPDAATGTFRTNSQTFWDHELPLHLTAYSSPFVSRTQACLHATAGGFTSAAFACEAYVPERINQTSTAITYAAIANDVCWTIISADNNGITGWTRVGTTAYYYQCEGDTTPNQPALPANSTWLMQVTITTSAIATVTDLRKFYPEGVDYAERFASFVAAIDEYNDAGDPNITLVVSSRMHVTANTTVTSNIALVVHAGGLFDIDSGVTLTVDCRRMQAGGYQIATGAGSIVCNNGGYFNGLWAGLVGDDSTNNTTAFARIAATTATDIHIPYGTYQGSNTTYLMTITDQVGVTIRGDGVTSTTLKQMSTGGGINIDASAGFVAAGNRPDHMHIQDMTLRGNDTAAIAISLEFCQHCMIENVNIAQFDNDSIYFSGVQTLHNIVRNCRITGSPGALTGSRAVRQDNGNLLRLEYNYFNGATNAASYAALVESSTDTLSIGNTYDGAATGVITSGHFSSIMDRFDFSSGGTGEIITAFNKTNNTRLKIDSPNGPTLESHVTFGGTDRRWISWENDSNNAERGFRAGVPVWSQLTPAAFTGNVNDYAPTNEADSTIWRLDAGGTPRTITGIIAGVTGQVKCLVNIGTGTFTLPNEDVLSAAANRIRTNEFALSYELRERETACLWYDGGSTRWRLIMGNTPQRLFGSAVTNLGALTAPGCANASVTVTGAAVGDRCVCASSVAVAATSTLSCDVSATNTALCKYCDLTVNTDPASATYSVDVWKN